MSDSENETTIGTGGWVLVCASGVVSLAVLRGLMGYMWFPSLTFALAIALVVMLVLYRLAAAVNRYDDEEEARRVRKIVPAQAPGATAAVAVPVRPETATPVPQRPSSVVKPLAEVAPAPIIAPPPMPVPEPKPEAAPVMDLAPVTEEPKPKKAPAKSKAEPKPKAKATPKAKAATEAAPKAAGKAKAEPKPKAEKAAKPKAEKPVGLVRLKAPRKGKADDLQEIEGIGPALEKLVNSLGFYHFDQIAAWSEADVALVDAEMKTFKGRIARDRWVEQAKIIVNDGIEAFRERAKTNDY